MRFINKKYLKLVACACLFVLGIGFYFFNKKNSDVNQIDSNKISQVEPANQLEERPEVDVVKKSEYELGESLSFEKKQEIEKVMQEQNQAFADDRANYMDVEQVPAGVDLVEAQSSAERNPEVDSSALANQEIEQIENTEEI
ncbi:MAG: hypothetical protein M9962_01385 [Oligoflexia bacterium]|nr:hypothetical protein [Oligoflexia bacterium]